MGQQQKPTDSEKQLVALGRVLQTLREEENIDVLIETTIQYIRSEFDYHLIWIGLYDRVEHRLFGKGGMMPAGNTSVLKQRFVLSPGDLLEQVVIQQRPVGVPDLREERRAGEWRKIAQTFNIQGTMIFPIRYRALCFGVVILGSTLWGTSPRSDEKARLSMIFGELAGTLNQIEVNWHRQQTKRPEEPLFSLLTKMRSLPNLSQRLAAIVEETHSFINPTRTNIYWFERERRYFWRRVGNQNKIQGLGESHSSASGITVQEVSSFYKALAADQLVAIGEAHSSLKADTTSRLMQQIKARSLLAAPILYQNELLGFLAVEGNEARIWEESEKNYVRSAAQLIALISPLEEMETTIERIKQDQTLTSEISRAIYSEQDWKDTLSRCANLLCDRFNVVRFLVFLYNPDRHNFDIACQNQPANRRPLAGPLQLDDEDEWRLLETSQSAIAIENWEEDMRLMGWRSVFLEAGVRSLLICSTSPGQPLEGLLMVAHEVPRTWDAGEQELLRVVSQQVGLILHQWQLHTANSRQQKIHSYIQWGLAALQHIDQTEQLERSAIQQIAQIIQVPLAILLTWSPDHPIAQIAACEVHNPQFAITPEVKIALNDPLIQMAIASDSLLALSAESLTPQTRTWLSGASVGEVLVMALHTAPEHEPTGLVLVADFKGRPWGERNLDAIGTLIAQLAWSRRTVQLTGFLHNQRENLERLNWYKQRRIEDSYRAIGAEVRKLNDMGIPKDALTVTRYQQGLRAVSTTMASLTQMLKDEQWRLRMYAAAIPLVSLLKRALERVDGLIKERQLWTQVRGDTAAIQVIGDIIKVELILYEILVAAGERSPQGGRIDIWPRVLDIAEVTAEIRRLSAHNALLKKQKSPTGLLELSITDLGQVSGQLINELQSGRSGDLLAKSSLDRPPGLHLLICQSLMRHLGGDFTLYQLEDGRVLSRLLLPIK
ncbi:GAF domain-containing protein [Desertifilum sp. FACHB-1129]|uniref:Histidine kinase n=1 Tax=Desertifilum tharense IPPAS B-1220 TaxID=1781255 RepID=A0A1E5QQ95_9CYAN|nr:MULTISPECIES: GAF domain-containing protein [Desertifilum]MDA0209142.1 GAF domain-containing protein [Cyanobacteria bacterium FC1]MBD2311796.1 GAF domain-containing protein [Desertifilum sp. FACHB-1129]MBD2322940.1 GAF domain-containing protein [Desertifilum sp. FACHB-866]MBD2333371.1 GAF domain-containing protein [Desertifilum sp. FACHB-868]OEJ76784.1 histidine kinase [Desertifilum tharense IPPAS B-1220]